MFGSDSQPRRGGALLIDAAVVGPRASCLRRRLARVDTPCRGPTRERVRGGWRSDRAYQSRRNQGQARPTKKPSIAATISAHANQVSTANTRKRTGTVRAFSRTKSTSKRSEINAAPSRIASRLGNRRRRTPRFRACGTSDCMPHHLLDLVQRQTLPGNEATRRLARWLRARAGLSAGPTHGGVQVDRRVVACLQNPQLHAPIFTSTPSSTRRRE